MARTKLFLANQFTQIIMNDLSMCMYEFSLTFLASIKIQIYEPPLLES